MAYSCAPGQLQAWPCTALRVPSPIRGLARSSWHRVPPPIAPPGEQSCGSRPCCRPNAAVGERVSGPAAPSRTKSLPAPCPSPPHESSLVKVGHVKGAFGVRGEIRVVVTTDDPNKRFGKDGVTLYLQAPKPKGLLARVQQQQPLAMIKVTTKQTKERKMPHRSKDWVLRFQEVDDRDQAEQLQGYTLLLPRAVQGKLVEPDTFWARDLGGCHAFVKGSREYLGQVVDVFSGFGTYDTLLVQLALTAQDIQASRSRQCMVPFVKAMCPTVDLERRQIEMDLPEGLLDLAVTKRLDRPFTPEQVASRLAVLKSGRSPVWGQRMPEELQAALHVLAPSLAGTEQSDPAESARHTEVETEQVKQAAIVAPASAPKGGADRRSALRKPSMLRSRLPSRPRCFRQ
ncbi:RimM N-terminal domain-containing protein [Haematococcus lacustris]